jgi:hypothetical protein
MRPRARTATRRPALDRNHRPPTTGHDRTGAEPEEPHRPIQEIAPRTRAAPRQQRRSHPNRRGRGHRRRCGRVPGSEGGHRRCGAGAPESGGHRRRTDGAPGAGTPEPNDGAPEAGTPERIGAPARRSLNRRGCPQCKARPAAITHVRSLPVERREAPSRPRHQRGRRACRAPGKRVAPGALRGKARHRRHLDRAPWTII